MRVLPVAIIVVFAFQPLYATIINVPAEHATIQAALEATTPGDTVRVARGVWAERLVAPAHSLALMSWYPFTGDTLDVQQTVLDGEGLGTVLRLPAPAGASSLIEGLTFTGGLGDLTHGGAIHNLTDADLTVRYCHFEGNHSVWPGSAIYAYRYSPTWSHARVTLEHISLRGNVDSDVPYARAVEVATIRPVRLYDMRAMPQDSSFAGGVSITSLDSLLVSHVWIEGADEFLFVCRGATATYDSVVVRDMVASDICLTGSWTRTRGLHFTNLEVSSSSSLCVVGDSLVQVDGFEIRNCRKDDSFSETVSIAYVSSSTHQGPSDSWLRNLEFTGNRGGREFERPSEGRVTRLFDASNASVEDARFIGNTMHFWGWPDGQPNSSFSALARFQFANDVDSARVLRCVFEDNLLVDHDVYTVPPPQDWSQSPNHGRSLNIELGSRLEEGIFTRELEVGQLLFRNNRQPNHAPEAAAMGGGVGSDFWFDGSSTCTERIHVHDILLEHIDDGGFHVAGLLAQENVIENVVIRDVARSGLVVYGNPGGTRQVSNIWIEGVDEQDLYQGYPYCWSAQNAFGGSPATVFSNITVKDCNLTNLHSCRGTLLNSIITNCNYTYFYNPCSEDLYPNTYGYCYADLELDGAGNLVGTSPGFDLSLGAPWLADDSPCVDAGHPTSSYNDLEDPAHPGFALWPSLGGLRNDIGFTGGPHAAAIDTSWAALPTWEPRLVPRDFSLGAPWPNPFNPATRVPFTLTRPLPVRLVVHNLLGQEVAVLLDETLPVGRHSCIFDGHMLASGVYLVHLTADKRSASRKVLLLK